MYQNVQLNITNPHLCRLCKRIRTERRSNPVQYAIPQIPFGGQIMFARNRENHKRRHRHLIPSRANFKIPEVQDPSSEMATLQCVPRDLEVGRDGDQIEATDISLKIFWSTVCTMLLPAQPYDARSHQLLHTSSNLRI